MAEFNPQVQSQGVPNYDPGNNGKYMGEANQAGSILLEGFAKALDAGVKGLDSLVQENIRNDVTAGYDKVVDEFGLNDAADVAGASSPREIIQGSGADGVIPPDEEGKFVLGPFADRAKKVASAYQSGAINEAYYAARMFSMTKDIRAKYPGYREQVDNIVADVTGMRPANALAQEMFAMGAKANAAANQRNTLVRGMADEGSLPADYNKRESAGQPYTDAQLLEIKNNFNKTKADQAATQARLTQATSESTLQYNDVEKAWRTEAQSEVEDAMNNLQTSFGVQWHDIQSKLGDYQKRISEGGTVSPDEQAQLTQLYNNYESAVKQRLMARAQKQWEGSKDPSNRYSTYIKAEDLDKDIQTAMYPLTVVRDAIVDKNFGVLSAAAAWNEANKNTTTKAIAQKYPVINLLGGLKDMVGDTGLNTVLSLIPQARTAVTEILQKSNIADAFINGLKNPNDPNGPPVKPIAQAFNEAKDAQAPAEFYRNTVQEWVNSAIDPKVNPTTFRIQTQRFFGPGNEGILAQMDPQSQLQYFATVASPAVSQAMIQRAKSDPQSYQMYAGWVSNAFQGLFRQQLRTLDQYSLDDNQMKVIWSPQQGQFVMQRNPATPGNTGLGRIPDAMVSGALGLIGVNDVVRNPFQMDADDAMMKKTMDNLNSTLRVMVPLLQASGTDVTQYLQLLMRSVKAQ